MIKPKVGDKWYSPYSKGTYYVITKISGDNMYHNGFYEEKNGHVGRIGGYFSFGNVSLIPTYLKDGWKYIPAKKPMIVILEQKD